MIKSADVCIEVSLDKFTFKSIHNYVFQNRRWGCVPKSRVGRFIYQDFIDEKNKIEYKVEYGFLDFERKLIKKWDLKNCINKLDYARGGKEEVKKLELIESKVFMSNIKEEAFYLCLYLDKDGVDMELSRTLNFQYINEVEVNFKLE